MTGNLLIKNAAQLVTCSGFNAKRGKHMSELHIIEDGAVLISSGVIEKVGLTHDILSGDTLSDSAVENYQIIDASNKAVLPGFVDSHTHFVFGGYRADEFSWRIGGSSYMDIMKRGGGINNSVRATREATKEDLIQLGLKRLDSMLSFGVTTVEGKSGYGLETSTEVKQLEVMEILNKLHPIDIIGTFMGAHAIPDSYAAKNDLYIDYLIQDMMPEVLDRNLAEFCDVFCEKGVFSVAQSERLLRKAKEMGLKLKIHADEMAPLGGAELAAELGAISADHLLCASDRGLAHMAEKGVVATLLPGTAFCLKESYARARHMIDNDGAVALATDFNPGSCFTESTALIVALATLYMGMTTAETITALTINGAAALDRADTIGSIDVGKKGDVVILEFPSYHFMPYHTGVSTVETVIKNGQIVFDKNGRTTCVSVF